MHGRESGPMTRMIEPRTVPRRCRDALSALALIAGAAPAAAQGFDIRSLFSSPGAATATPPAPDAAPRTRRANGAAKPARPAIR